MRTALDVADRILALTGIVGTIVLIAIVAHEYGREQGFREAREHCKPKIHRMVYGAEEHFRAGRAIRRMEAIK